MAEINWQIGLLVGTQGGEGNVNDNVSNATTIGELTGGGDPGAGGILGSPDSGIGESGIDVTFAREDIELAVVSGSFTQQQGSFLREAIESFTVAWPLRGRCAFIPSVDGSYEPRLGQDALLRGMGLVGAGWTGGLGWRYVPGAAISLTCKLWIGPLAWVFQDCTVSGQIEFTPGGVAVVTSEIHVGSVTSFASPGFPGTVDYTVQATVPAPVVKGVAHAWGATRGFNSLTLNFENEIEELEDSNAPSGIRKRAASREITADVVMWADDADSDFERANLVSTSPSTTVEVFTAGTPGADPSNAYTVSLTNPQATSLKPAKLQDRLGWEMTLKAVDGVANGEFELIFK